MDSNQPTARSAAVVLAAGVGSRLRGVTHGPKWLAPIAGRPIADRHLRGLAAADDLVDRVVVVTGYRAGDIAAYLGDAGDAVRLPVELVENARYADRNNWWSLALALHHLGDPPGPVLVCNSDFVTPPDTFETIVRDLLAHPTRSQLVVDVDRPLTPEAMKVATAAAAAGGSAFGPITAIAKTAIERPVGEYVGAALLAADDVALVRSVLRSFERRSDRQDAWYENALVEAVRSGMELHLCPMPSDRWMEVDDGADAAAADRLLTEGATVA